jgi:hypothetical protein
MSETEPNQPSVVTTVAICEQIIERLTAENRDAVLPELFTAMFALEDMSDTNRKRLFKATAKALGVSVKDVQRDFMRFRGVDPDATVDDDPDTLLLALMEKLPLTPFLSDESVEYVTYEDEAARVTYPIDSRPFRHYLFSQFYERYRFGPTNSALAAAVALLSHQARKQPMRTLNLRVGAHGDTIYVDLADVQWSAVAIDTQGWRHTAKPPAIFRRVAHQHPQVVPQRPPADARLEDLLATFVNIPRGDVATWLLLKAWLVAAFVPFIPHAVLVVTGDKGASKSTAMRWLRRLIDPSKTELLTVQRDPTELARTLYNHAFAPLDNVSSINGEQSDVLCKAVTGAGMTLRRLYTDNEQFILQMRRVIAINGITLATNASDLLDRSVTLTLERIPEEARQTEAALEAAFETQRPMILGAIFDALSRAMQLHPSVQGTLPRLPRMADFAEWGYAICEATQSSSTTDNGEAFLTAYRANINRGVEEAVTGSPVAMALLYLLEEEAGTWQGTPTQLLGALRARAGRVGVDERSRQWPRDPKGLTKRLHQLRSDLLQMGLRWDQQSGGHRKYAFTYEPREGGIQSCGAHEPSARVAPSPVSRAAREPASGGEQAASGDGDDLPY